MDDGRLAPFDVQLTEARVIEPDVVVARRADVTDKDLPIAPLLSVGSTPRWPA